MVVEVFGSMKDFGMGRVVVVVCLSVGLSGFHPRNLFCEKSHEEAGMVLMWIVRGELHNGVGDGSLFLKSGALISNNLGFFLRSSLDRCVLVKFRVSVFISLE